MNGLIYVTGEFADSKERIACTHGHFCRQKRTVRTISAGQQSGGRMQAAKLPDRRAIPV